MCAVWHALHYTAWSVVRVTAVHVARDILVFVCCCSCNVHSQWHEWSPSSCPVSSPCSPGRHSHPWYSRRRGITMSPFCLIQLGRRSCYLKLSLLAAQCVCICEAGGSQLHACSLPTSCTAATRSSPAACLADRLDASLQTVCSDVMYQMNVLVSVATE